MNNQRGPTNLESFRGNWGLITGASSGIGLEYARRAAAAGLNLVCVARNRDPLNDLARELEKTNNVQIRVICSDLAQPEESIKIADQLKAEKIRIRFLCHAAGFGYWGSFLGGNSRLYSRMVNLHVNATIDLLLQFHDDLASHSTSAVVVFSSLAGFYPVPTMAVYAATKSFSQSFSQALFCEWEKDGIYVQTLMPGAVATELEANKKLIAAGVIKREEMQSPKEVVESSLRGMAQKRPRVITGKSSTLPRFFFAVLPRRFFLRSVKNFFSMPRSREPK